MLLKYYLRAEDSHLMFSEGGTVFGRVEWQGAMSYSCTSWSKLANLIAVMLHSKEDYFDPMFLRYIILYYIVLSTVI
jgi:hypothetical protein